jgi:hypothetical protein
MYGIQPGMMVVARRHLDKHGANVPKGTKGVVNEATVYAENRDGSMHGGHVHYGPQVRWFTGGTCNVYPGQVTIERSLRRLPLIEADALMSARWPVRHGRPEVRAWIWERVAREDRARRYAAKHGA